MSAHEPSTKPGSSASVLDYLRLFRISNLFTAFADITMGYLVAHATLQPAAPFVCLLLASGLLYTAGMVLNDVFDADWDREHRPERPIPSGRISRSRAASIGFGLLIGGVAAGWTAGLLQLGPGASPWRSGVVVTLLAICVLLYDARVKATVAGPVAMGGCRLLNVLLGMSTGALATGDGSLASFAAHQWIAASGIGVFIAGVTWFARYEAGVVRPGRLGAATGVMMAGFVILGLFHRSLPADIRAPAIHEGTWWMLLGLMGMTVLRRCGMAITDPVPVQVRLTVTHAIWSLIMLDAALALEVTARHGQWYYSVGIVALLVPTALLGRWIPAT